MSQPVWTLSVDLQAKTASFTTGLAGAAQAARSSFGDIRNAAQDMGDGVSEASSSVNYSMTEARHGVMMLGEEFGVHLPRGITTFIASLGPVGAAMEAAFPFLAIILGATLLIEHLMKASEAAEKLAEAGNKLNDGMAESINKVDQEILNSSIEIRKLAGDPAWDLLAKKLELQDAEKGMQNVSRLEKSIADLLKAAPSTSNWNPFNWGDHSGDMGAQAKSFQEQMRGKSQGDQAVTAKNALDIQSKVLQNMKEQTDTSAAQLKNQQTYVDFLKQEAELLQKSTDAAVLADQAQQGKDKKERDDKADEAQNKEAEAEQRGLDKRLRIEEEYYKKSQTLAKKAAEEQSKDNELEAKANEAFAKEVMEQDNQRLKIAEDMGKEEANVTRKMSSLKLAADEEQIKSEAKLGKLRGEDLEDAEIAAQSDAYEAQMRGYETELAALDKYGKDYAVKVKQIQDKEAELTREHANKILLIETQAADEKNARILASENRGKDLLAKSAMSVLSGHESAGKALIGIGNQVASGMMENAIKSVMANDFTKESDAAAAARKAYLAGMHFPFPINIVMGPLLGAAAFASVMAFEGGGLVPGVEKGDVVPARLTPGEGVLPKPLMDNLKHASAPVAPQTIHRHNHEYHMHAIDGPSVERMLTNHSDKFEKHVEGHFRKRNM